MAFHHQFGVINGVIEVIVAMLKHSK